MSALWPYLAAGAALVLPIRALHSRLMLSRAKHPSLGGHSRIARRVAGLVPYYGYSEDELFTIDGAPPDVAARRRSGFEQLGRRLRDRAPQTLATSRSLRDRVPDVDFTNAYRVPFQFREVVAAQLEVGHFLSASRGRQVCDLDGNWSYDLSGSYGVNLLGYDFYKQTIEEAVEFAAPLGPVLGHYHGVLADNVDRLLAISGQDAVSFHMSGTEAVMQAVRLARYHTRRSHVVRFCGAYHGWWDGVQPGVGNPRPPHEIYTLRDMDPRTLRVLRSRRDIACVLVNPLQALHPNSGAPSDSTLVGGERHACYDKAAYAAWLKELREVCSERGIVLIFDEVFLGFRLAAGGAQEYFGVKADLVTYGKTLGGGLPVGVVCGRRDLMKRFRDDRPSDICFARGTFNSHPYVMSAMNAFLRHLDRPDVRDAYADIDRVWDQRAADLNRRLNDAEVPVRVANMTSVWTTLYDAPGRFNWMLQYYLRDQGLTMSWVGTGRFIFSHDFTSAEFEDVLQRFVRAARRMKADGWWWREASLTGRKIKRGVLRELVRARFR